MSRQQQAGGLPLTRAQYFTQPVRPGERGFRDLGLDGGEVDFPLLLRVGSHHDVNTSVVGSRDLHVALDLLALEAFENDLFDPLPDFRVVAIARHVDEARVEAVVGITSYEETHGAALVQVHYAAR